MNNNFNFKPSPTLDKAALHFYTYILKLSNGDFYIGYTRDLQPRLSEHKDGILKNLNPKLQYFELLPSRFQAEQRETELKSIKKTNPRQIRRMIADFENLSHKLDYS